MRRHVKINENGRRIGESHHWAVLSDHDTDLLLALLSEREALIKEMRNARARQVDIDRALATSGLSYRCLAEKFEISKSHVQHIALGYRRCQTPV